MRRVGALAVILGTTIASADVVPQASGEARIAPSTKGAIGAWLLIGPFRSSTFNEKKKPPGSVALDTAPPGVDEIEIAAAKLNDSPPSLTSQKNPPRWTLASSGEGPVDVKAALKANESDQIAYAAGTLHVPKAGKYLLLVGTDDGLRLSVDNKVVLVRDESRPYREDDDVIPVDLAAGDHPLLLKLHQRDGAWMFRFRIVDRFLAPPTGAYLTLPGTTRADSEALAGKMSWISLDRGMSAEAYRPKLTVKFLEGTPMGVPLRVKARIPKIFDVDAGEVPSDTGELTVSLPAIAPSEVDGRNHLYTIDVAGRSITPVFYPRKQVRDAVARADKWLASIGGQKPQFLKPDSAESIEHLRDRLVSLQSHGDPDIDAELNEALELSQAVELAEKSIDPFARKTGPMRLAYRSPMDDQLQEYALYVPPGYKPGGGRNWPLVVVLHGLNGRQLSMIRYFFGGDDEKKEGEWEERHIAEFLKDGNLELEAFVVAPSGHGNTMYRDLGEDDVMRVTERIMARYPIDRDRVTITGPSMGGIGSAGVPLHNPDFFAAAMPLCGYHSYFVRRDILGRPIRPWERAVAEERSNALWAENGQRLPLYIVHGTQDLPVENSQVLIDRYEALKFDVEHEHPNLGHNVWQTTYEDFKGAKWLLKHHRDAHPSHVKFKTMTPRHGDDAWIHVIEMDDIHQWAGIDAREAKKGISATTKNISEIRFDRDPKLIDPTVATPITIDGQSLTAPETDAIVLHKEGASWQLGPAKHSGVWKKGEILGPIRDAFHAPLLFVYGTDDPEQARANEEVARSWAMIRRGVHVKYPVISDAEFFAKNEALANEKALFLVGNAKSNRVVRALEADFPIKVENDAIAIGGQKITGKQLGAAFIRPNPKKTDRYVVVIEGIDAVGTWRSLSLPDILPDFVIYDEQIAPSRGQMIVASGLVRAGGFFGMDWSLPAKIDDPLAATIRPPAATEKDATPYLP